MTYSYTRSATFTITHARQITSKVAADMHLCANYYGTPSEQHIRNLAEEFAQLLKDGYVSEYEFGYKNNGRRVLSWRYRVSSNGTITTDDRPGSILSTIDVSGAVFYTYLWYSATWSALTDDEQHKIEDDLPIRRTTGDPPSDGNGYWTGVEKQYSSSGVGLTRATYRPYQL